MLMVKELSKRFGTKQAIADLSLTLEEGHIFGLLGTNGAGKSTMVEAISQGAPYSGNILLQGKNIRSYKPGQLARMVGVLAQKNQFTTYQGGRLANRTPNASSVIAAKLVLDGASAASDALYFFNPSKTSASWIVRNRTYLVTIGNHAFYR